MSGTGFVSHRGADWHPKFRIGMRQRGVFTHPTGIWFVQCGGVCFIVSVWTVPRMDRLA